MLIKLRDLQQTKNIHDRFDILMEKLQRPITKSGNGLELAQSLDQAPTDYYQACCLLQIVINERDRFKSGEYQIRTSELKRKIETILEEKKRDKLITGTISADKINNYVSTHAETKKDYLKLEKTLRELNRSVDSIEYFVKAWEKRCNSLQKLASITNTFIVGTS